ncbi:DUF406 family protein [Vibrio ostreicida]|uniref:DUF406 family protein n=1 Tax=Vibrio ostreicida TaxID=526588 RepID=A0ABT8BYU4_9VIBR|nr:DUF406 family protein [Vibrio ostreicida]MDN3611848.1 DUF406 family protein [Vibrio ostreicida]NPD09658.1 DUF406 family protein [Vibrio ostreicida]
METKSQHTDLSEACGCTGEIGLIIKERDTIAHVTLVSNDTKLYDEELTRYLTLAKQICPEVKYQVTTAQDINVKHSAQFEFNVTAEKLIFELKARSLSL